MDRIHWIDRIPGYHYYDTPEGEDCLKKVIFMNKMGLFFGISAATIDVIAYTKPVGFANIASRYVMISWPIMAVGSTFAAVTCLSTSLRGKDDTYNYSLGGFAAGCVAGAAMRSGTFGTSAAVLFAAMAYTKKHCEEIGQPLFGTQQKSYDFGGFWSNRWDWSLIGEGEKGWRKSEN
uniref:NADH dehydrogenase [ubiquinone] 1 alpha subcomplex subunit 11 n=1 Tax=Cuerna arida TaxID=1464854 RepID=A0A1B6H0T4_9HEMI